MAKTFLNDEIFPADGDYVIGGFETNQEDNFKYSEFYANLRDRFARLIEEYLRRTEMVHLENGHEDPKKAAQDDLALVLNDTLLIQSPYMDTETVVESLVDSAQVTKWLDGIKENISWSGLSVAGKYKGVYNKALEVSEDSEAYQNATQFTNDTTLEALLEQLSIIEL